MNTKEFFDSFTNEEFVVKVEEKLLEIAGEYPDTVYNTYKGGCFYHTGEVGSQGQYGCIFGQAFRRLGWTPECVEHLDTDSSIHHLCTYFHKEVPESWAEVQQSQDHGSTWSKAVSFLSCKTSFQESLSEAETLS
jgi:hypothetical protein